MDVHCVATFQVVNWEESPFDHYAAGTKVTRAEVTKTYSGDVDGESITQWLMSYDEDGSATFVGMERLVGRIAGQTGSLVLQHVGAFEAGAAKADLSVTRGSGTEDLAGATGTGKFLADPAGSVTLDLSLDR